MKRIFILLFFGNFFSLWGGRLFPEEYQKRKQRYIAVADHLQERTRALRNIFLSECDELLILAGNATEAILKDQDDICDAIQVAELADLKKRIASCSSLIDQYVRREISYFSGSLDASDGEDNEYGELHEEWVYLFNR